MKKMYYVTTFILLLLVSFFGVTYSYEYNGNGDGVNFSLIGPKTLYVDVNTEYQEYGVKVTYMGKDITNSVIIDSNDVNTSILGEYKVKYQVNINDTLEYVYRDVKVIDKVAPVIKLLGEEVTYVLLNGEYYEEGYTVSDNYDRDLNDNVKISGKVELNKEGSNFITYTVSDNSGNKSSVTREVIVKKEEVSVANTDGNRRYVSSYDHKKYDNTIITNKFNANGIYYEGYIKEDASLYKIKLKDINSSLEYLYNMSVSKKNYYKGNLDLTTVKNGEYQLYIIGNSEQKLYNKLDGLTRLLRAKVGNKLITFEYDKDAVKMIVSDFKYEYDIMIDPGHGGSDIGSSNGVMLEKNLNLKISKYEKCRYESMGYKVYMTRHDDSLGEELGSKNLIQLQRRALTIGYYGAVSRITYSNHHNGSKNKKANGFEIIVPNSTGVDDLVVELSLYNKYKSFYNIKDKNIRFYSRNNDTDAIYNKSSAKIYNSSDYYVVQRVPYELFNVKTVIYEPIYLTNSSDYSCYYVKKNWIKISEMKINEYVNYLGGEYSSDNTNCL